MNKKEVHLYDFASFLSVVLMFLTYFPHFIAIVAGVAGAAWLSLRMVHTAILIYETETVKKIIKKWENPPK